MKIGVFGGTFDPVHVGHLIGAERSREVLGLDQVLFIPAGQPYFKADRRITEAPHRLAMVELAVESNPGFAASDMEISRPGPTYTVDTLEELSNQLGPETELFVILGVDSLRELERWHQPRRILDMSRLVALPRPDMADPDARMLDAISPGSSSRVEVMDGPLIDVSASDIRYRVSQGLSIRYLVPEAVEAHIHEHGLYMR